MKPSRIKGPGIFLAQFIEDSGTNSTLSGLASWVSELGYEGVQVPSWDKRVFDLDTAGNSQSYLDEFVETLKTYNLELIELAGYLQGQCLAMHPCYQQLFQSFYPKGYQDHETVEWSTLQLKTLIEVSAKLGLKNISVLSGGLAWPFVYPWPQRPDGLIDLAFDELVKRWMPILDYAKDHEITIGFELHPGSDLFDGFTFNKFLEGTGEHQAACITYDPSHMLLQQLDYLKFLDIFGDRVTAFHVKDAEFNPNALGGVYGGYQSWKDRPGRFRSLGDGQIDFKGIFSKLTAIGYQGWAILEWECAIKSSQQGAAEGSRFIRDHIITTTKNQFDDFAKSNNDIELNKKTLGI